MSTTHAPPDSCPVIKEFCQTRLPTYVQCDAPGQRAGLRGWCQNPISAKAGAMWSAARSAAARPGTGSCVLSAVRTLLLPAVRSGWPGPCASPLPPIGLTAADLFAGGKVSRADSRVR